jgi:transposase InsO family protein
MPTAQMVVINNIPHLSVKDLIGFGFSQSFVDKQTSLGNYSSLYAFDPDQPTRKEVKLIPYDSIPEQTRIDKKIPSREELLKTGKQKELFRLTGLDQEAYQYFLTHPEIKDTKDATREHIAKGKAEQVHLLKAIASLKTKEVTCRGFSNKDEFYEFCIQALNDLAQQRRWYKWKCSTVNEFQKRLTVFKKVLKGSIGLPEACGKLVSKKANNVNAEKLGDDQKAVLVQLMSDAHAKPNFEQVWQIYTRKATDMISLGHWSQDILISESAVRAFLSKPNIMQLWYEARHGYQEYRNVYEPITERERPSFANALWIIDATPNHRYFQNGDTGKYFRWQIVPVLDAHSWCVIGFFLDVAENTDSVMNALRSACMVSGCLPHQILYDNGSANKSFRVQDAMDKISIVHFPAATGNARSKIIENWFHLFNQDVQKFRKGFTGNPFALKLDNRANREALARLVKAHELPEAERAVKEAIEDLTIMNNIPRKFLGGKSPIEVYRKSVEETRSKQRQFTKVIDVEAFYTLPGATKQVRTYIEGKAKMVSTFVAQTYEFTNRGIEISINGKEYTYDIEDAHFRTLHIGQRFTVRYEGNPDRWGDRQQPDCLYLYLQGAPLQWNGVHAAALPKERMPMAISDYQPGTRATLDNRLANKKTQRALVQQNLQAIIEHTKRNGTYTEAITDNAFDKKILQETSEQILNSLIEGAETWATIPAPTPKSEPNIEPFTFSPKADRLSDYDQPLPLE